MQYTIMLVQFINPKDVSDPICPRQQKLLSTLSFLKIDTKQFYLTCSSEAANIFTMVMIGNGKINECLNGP